MQSKTDMQDFVTALLKDHLHQNYYYHNLQHTLYVIEIAAAIGAHQLCTEKEMRLLHAAALWHDTGYINTYINHEEAGCLLAKEYLPLYGFIETDISAICGMIMATKVPQLPKNKLEEIIADADLEYLGTPGVTEKSALLFKELQSLTPSITEAAWNKMQIAFLQSHHFFTPFCKEKREPVKQAYLKKLVAAAG